jgi:O-antigen ligase
MVRKCSWLFAIALFGYPIVGDLVSLLQIDSRLLSVPFRLAVAFFSFAILLRTKGTRIDRLRFALLILWLLYMVRLAHDWLFTNLDGADYALQYFVAACVLPAVALMRARAFRPRRFALIGFIISSIGSILSLFANMFGSAEVQDVTTSSGRLALSALNSVSLGHLATSAILCGFVLWRGSAMRTKLFLSAMFVPLIWCLILTGSKGPAIALVFCMGLWALRHGQTFKFAIIAVPVVAWVIFSEDNSLATRLAGSEEDQSTVERVVILSDSFDQIRGSPLIGSAFVEFNSGFYPHNVFVEAGLALGIPGALFFFAVMLLGAIRAWRGLKGDYSLLGLLFFQGLFAASTSGAIFGAVMLWVPFAMLEPSLSPKKRRRRAQIRGTMFLRPGSFVGVLTRHSADL